MDDSRKITVWSPAKINLCLAVDGRLDSGFHALRSLICPVSLCDRIEVELQTSAGVCIKARLTPPLFAHQRKIAPAGGQTLVECEQTLNSSRNLVVLAANSLLKRLNLDRQVGFAVELEKAIPLQAGLGGGSSNAAAALLTCAALLRRAGIAAVEANLLYEIAAELGSDIAAFLSGGPQYVYGTGNCAIAAIPAAAKIAAAYRELGAVLVKPAVGVDTAHAYAQLGFAPGSAGIAQPVPEVLLDLLGFVPDTAANADSTAKKVLTLSEQDGISPLPEFRAVEQPDGLPKSVASEDIRTDDIRNDDRYSGSQRQRIFASFFNDFEPVIKGAYPEIDSVSQALHDAGAEKTLLAGSGGTVIGFVADSATARRLVELLDQYRVENNWYIAQVRLLL